jgi:hypothetical protein
MTHMGTQIYITLALLFFFSFTLLPLFAACWLAQTLPVWHTAEPKLGGVIDTAVSMIINFCIWSSAMTQRCHWHHWVKTQRCSWQCWVKTQRCNWHCRVQTQRCHWHRWVSEDTAESLLSFFKDLIFFKETLLPYAFEAKAWKLGVV